MSGRRWLAEHGIPLFRVGRSLIPFASHPRFPYNWAEEHGNELRRAGDLASWRTLVDALGDRAADGMVEAKGKELALVPMGIEL